MTIITIVPEVGGPQNILYPALAGERQSVGKTPGKALDALNAQLNENESSTLVIARQLRPDSFSSAQQQKRLTERMDRWRVAWDQQISFPAEDQTDLDRLVKAELDAAGARAGSFVRRLTA